MSEWKELKGIIEVASALADEMEIEVCKSINEWGKWDGFSWYHYQNYRARQRKPKTVNVKSLCWRDKDDGRLIWRDEKFQGQYGWQRFPYGDIEGVVEA